MTKNVTSYEFFGNIEYLHSSDWDNISHNAQIQDIIIVVSVVSMPIVNGTGSTTRLQTIST